MPPQIRESSCFDCSYSLPWMTMGFPSFPLQLQQWENHSSHRRAHTVLVVSHFFFLISHPCQILQISLENEYQMKMCSKQTHLKRLQLLGRREKNIWKDNKLQNTLTWDGNVAVWSGQGLRPCNSSCGWWSLHGR